MGTIIAVANQKGGVGKTTTAVNLSAALGEMGKKTLLVDADPQGNSSSGVGIDRKHSRKTVYELLIGECGVEEILVHTDYQNLDILPSSMNLAAAELELISHHQRIVCSGHAAGAHSVRILCTGGTVPADEQRAPGQASV